MGMHHPGERDPGARHHAFIGVGANIDPERNIVEALKAIRPVLPILEISRFYLTAPIGKERGPWFINGAIHVLSSLEARPLKFSFLRGIEQRLGRTRGDDKWAARPIDLDLLLFGDCAFEEEGLVLPSPDILRYPFVAVPLSELAPNLRLPGLQKPLRLIASEMDTSGMVYLERFTKDLAAILL